MLAFGLFLLDSKEINIYKLDQKKRISLSRIDKIFRYVDGILYVKLCYCVYKVASTFLKSFILMFVIWFSFVFAGFVRIDY